MRQVKRILNFRVSEELLLAIDQLGEKLYPTPARKDSKLNYDRTATLTDVIQAGIQALGQGEIVIHGINAESNLTTLTEEKVRQMVKECLTERKPESITEEMVNELISNAVSNQTSKIESRVRMLVSNAVSNQPSITEEMVNQLISNAISKPSNLTEEKVNELISNAVSNQPSITEEEVRELISSAVTNQPSLTEEKVKELISNSESFLESNTSAIVEKAITTATTPLLEKISSIESTLATWLDGDKLPSLSAPIDEADSTLQVKTEVVDPDSEPQGITSTSLSPIFSQPKTNQDSPPAAKVKFPFGLSQTKLAQRLGKTSNTVSKSCNKGKVYFKAWSKKYDPDGFAWELRTINNKGKHYSPCVD